MQPIDSGWRRWDEVDRLFTAALDLPESERESFIVRQCEGDIELRDAVLSVLTAERASADLFEGPESARAREALREFFSAGDSGAADHAGERIGPYRLIRRIGRGGMGTVFLAERADADFDQRVAVKLLRRGLDTEDIVGRFLSERRILARLTHPNIARLYDGGSSADGRPYLVMEYVDGEPVTDYCDARTLPLAQRLEFFLRVADAVRYAHAQLVVHRDLKPSNILVTKDGRVKLLDFGIAKILSPDADDRDAVTRTGVRVLTPEYASPEQLRGDPITTATDVFQLGILLFVLLTGRRPSSGDSATDDRAVATRASAAVGDGDAARIVARERATTPDRLRRALRGDLDMILGKSLREEPDRRYASVEQLAEDIRRHLAGLPIEARSESTLYRTGKFLRRHRWLVPTGAVAVLFAALFAGSSIRHAARLERERNVAREQAERADQVRRLLVDAFRSPDPFDPANPQRGRAITVVEAMDIGADRVVRELSDRPAIQASLLDAIVDVYTNLGASPKAVPLARRALALHGRVDGTASRAYREALGRLATSVGAGHDRAAGDSALVLYRRRLTLVDAARDATAGERVMARTDVANELADLGRAREAEPEFRRALAAADSSVPPAQLAATHRGLAGVLQSLGRAADAEPHARQALALDQAAFGEGSANVGMAYESLAENLSELGRNAEAAAEFQRAVDLLRATLGAENTNTVNALNNLALLRRRMGDFVGAERDLRTVLDLHIRTLGPNHREVGTTYQNLGAVLYDMGHLDEAAEMHRHAAAIYDSVLEPGSYLRAFPHLSLAAVEVARGNPAAGEASARLALDILEKALPAGHFATAVARCRLGRALLARGREQEGAAALAAAAEIIRASPQAAPYRDECLGALDHVANAPN